VIYLFLCACLIALGTLEGLAQATVMLLLCVFTIVNVAVLVLRRERVERRHFVTPRFFPHRGRDRLRGDAGEAR
jgi:APA family basic amino acid/polyamine antiporter